MDLDYSKKDSNEPLEVAFLFIFGEGAVKHLRRVL